MGEAGTIPADLEQRIMRLVAAERSLPLERVELETTLQDLGFDSLDGINMCFVIEESFGVDIPTETINTLVTVRDVVEGVRTLLEQRAG